jgi:mannose-6-phosphate isomerase-like protein (cupin superfamily)
MTNAPPEVLHGGAFRQPVRWRREGAGAPDKLSWYSIAAGDHCTLHRHTGKAETWLIVSGEGRVVIGDDNYDAQPGDAFVTEPGCAHALWNTGAEPLTFVNIVKATGGPVTTIEIETA